MREGEEREREREKEKEKEKEKVKEGDEVGERGVRERGLDALASVLYKQKNYNETTYSYDVYLFVYDLICSKLVLCSQAESQHCHHSGKHR